MKYFEVQHLSAGPFSQGVTVTDEDIKKAGFDPDNWTSRGAIKQIADPADPPAKAEPAAQTATAAKPITPIK